MSYLPNARRFVVAAAAIAAVATLSANTRANVYPTNLGQSANSFSVGQNLTLSYLLNEPATAVTVSILDSANNVVRTINGGTAAGVNQVAWDGKDDASANLPAGDYSFRVTSMGAARSNWDLISTDSVLNNFELPRGVAVNKNPDSPYYGRVYVSNARSNPTAAGRTMGDGLYMVNADFSDTGIAGGTGPHSGGVDWAAGGTVGPYRVEVGPDDQVYITDWSDAHSGLWQAPPDLSGTWTEILDSSSGRDAGGATSVHGSIADVVITGTGANRKLYTAEEDLGTPGNILFYNIGTDTVFTEEAGSTERSGQFFKNVPTKIINYLTSLAVDKRGDFWYSQYRFNGTEPGLFRIDPETGLTDWDSLQLGNPDPLRGAQGIAYDPNNDIIAVSSLISGNIVIFDPVDLVVLDSFVFGEGVTNTDIAFDNAGNLYVGNLIDERVRVWSPPNGNQAGQEYIANEFSTNSEGALGSISLTAGAAVTGDFNQDGSVNAADYVIWRENETANLPLPNDNGAATQAARFALWRSNFVSGGAGVGTGAAVPEPASAALVLLAMAGCALSRRRNP